MTYVMRDPFGDEEDVQTLARAFEICADFVRVAEFAIRKVEAAQSADDDMFGGFDQIAANWNHNVAVIARMKTDPQLQLDDKKARYTELAKSILEMAKACAEPPPQAGPS